MGGGEGNRVVKIKPSSTKNVEAGVERSGKECLHFGHRVVTMREAFFMIKHTEGAVF